MLGSCFAFAVIVAVPSAFVETAPSSFTVTTFSLLLSQSSVCSVALAGMNVGVKNLDCLTAMVSEEGRLMLFSSM